MVVVRAWMKKAPLQTKAKVSHPQRTLRVGQLLPYHQSAHHATCPLCRHKMLRRAQDSRQRCPEQHHLPFHPQSNPWKKIMILSTGCFGGGTGGGADRKSTRLNSSHTVISYAVFCLKKKKKITY